MTGFTFLRLYKQCVRNIKQHINERHTFLTTQPRGWCDNRHRSQFCGCHLDSLAWWLHQPAFTWWALGHSPACVTRLSRMTTVWRCHTGLVLAAAKVTHTASVIVISPASPHPW